MKNVVLIKLYQPTLKYQQNHHCLSFQTLKLFHLQWHRTSNHFIKCFFLHMLLLPSNILETIHTLLTIKQATLLCKSLFEHVKMNITDKLEIVIAGGKYGMAAWQNFVMIPSIFWSWRLLPIWWISFPLIYWPHFTWSFEWGFLKNWKLVS